MQLIHGKKKKKWLGYFLDIIKEDICEFESEKKTVRSEMSISEQWLVFLQ